MRAEGSFLHRTFSGPFSGLLLGPGFWLAVAVVAGTAIRLPQMVHPATGPYAFRLAQTVFGVREYARDGVDLSRLPLPVFGVADNVPFEFPLFQGLARELMRLGPDATTATRLAGLISFQVAVLLWGALLYRWVGAWAAVGTAVLMEFLPFGLLWGGSPLIDFFSVALGLAMVLALDRWLRGGSWLFLALGSLAASTVFLVKVTTVPVAGLLLLVSVALVVADRGWRTSWRRIVAALALGPGLALVPFAIWTRYADGVKADSPATTFLTSNALLEWNFGTWSQRTDPEIWQVLAQRVSHEIAGVGLVALAAALVAGLVFGDLRHRVVLVGLVLGTLAPVLIFLNLYAVHSYYLIAVFPLLCAIPAVGLAALGARFGRPVAVPATVVGAALIATTAWLPLGNADVSAMRSPGPVPALSTQLARVTPTDAGIVLVGCDWDPTYLYEADRTGLMFRDQTPAEAWAENDIEDYGFIARCDPSVDPAPFMPAGYGVERSDEANVFRIVASKS